MEVSISQIDRINARVYHADGVDRQYRSRLWLRRVETVALLKHQAALAGKDTLDIGVGTGRTTIYLAPLSRTYQAIDYSPVMVRAMHTVMPDAPVHLCDMRDMHCIADASVDFVFAPDNIFDVVDHAGRLATLQECRRVLRPGGTLMFNSHNRDWHLTGHAPRLAWSRNPVTQVRRTRVWLRSERNYRSLKSMRSCTDEYAIINDSGHDFALLHYYIDQTHQRRQLHTAGFDLCDVLDTAGTALSAREPAPHSPHLMYVSVRRATI